MNEPPFNAEEQDWVTVKASSYFFEPWCSEFEPGEAGQFVITRGGHRTRHRGVEVSVHGDGVSVWVPEGGSVYWCPDADHQSFDIPWETRLRRWDHERGEFY